MNGAGCYKVRQPATADKRNPETSNDDLSDVYTKIQAKSSQFRDIKGKLQIQRKSPSLTTSQNKSALRLISRTQRQN